MANNPGRNNPMSAFRAHANRIERASTLDDLSDLDRQINGDRSLGQKDRIVLLEKLTKRIETVGRSLAS